MVEKKEKKVNECDPVKELAKEILCAKIQSNDPTEGSLADIKEAYKIAKDFEDYKE